MLAVQSNRPMVLGAPWVLGERPAAAMQHWPAPLLHLTQSKAFDPSRHSHSRWSVLLDDCHDRVERHGRGGQQLRSQKLHTKSKQRGDDRLSVANATSHAHR